MNQAGQKALEFQNRGRELGIERKKDSSIVTEADYWVQNFLVDRISKRFPRFNFIYEENFDPAVPSMDENKVNVIIDPIDGTAMFSMGLPIWCVSLGFFQGYEPRYGFVYAPGSRIFLHNDHEKTYLNDEPVKVLPDMEVDSESNIFHSSEIKGKLEINFPGKVRNLGSTALHAALIADNERNRVMAFTGKSYIWDWAGAVPIILRAGGTVRYLNGKEIDFRTVEENQYAMEDFVVASYIDDKKLMQEIFATTE